MPNLEYHTIKCSDDAEIVLPDAIFSLLPLGLDPTMSTVVSATPSDVLENLIRQLTEQHQNKPDHIRIGLQHLQNTLTASYLPPIQNLSEFSQEVKSCQGAMSAILQDQPPLLFYIAHMEKVQGTFSKLPAYIQKVKQLQSTIRNINERIISMHANAARIVKDVDQEAAKNRAKQDKERARESRLVAKPASKPAFPTVEESTITPTMSAEPGVKGYSDRGFSNPE
eukprot:TRINITY_DN53125_c0_g1_i1.p1 TRINITY_DN53125_c0_g1~~TRINITY_DN53125_c0_g1_i1.p1  ORF type:complete len:225 (+),score=8.37 TRINITY_DN53125_c0_g1_i1:28-702(+)